MQVMVSYPVFNLPFFWWLMILTKFPSAYLSSFYPLMRFLFNTSPIFKLCYLFSYCWVREFFVYSGYKSFIGYVVLKYILLVHILILHSHDSIFGRTKCIKSDEVQKKKNNTDLLCYSSTGERSEMGLPGLTEGVERATFLSGDSGRSSIFSPFPTFRGFPHSLWPLPPSSEPAVAVASFLNSFPLPHRRTSVIPLGPPE